MVSHALTTIFRKQVDNPATHLTVPTSKGQSNRVSCERLECLTDIRGTSILLHWPRPFTGTQVSAFSTYYWPTFAAGSNRNTASGGRGRRSQLLPRSSGYLFAENEQVQSTMTWAVRRGGFITTSGKPTYKRVHCDKHLTVSSHVIFLLSASRCAKATRPFWIKLDTKHLRCILSKQLHFSLL